jgi:hypothetical protein
VQDDADSEKSDTDKKVKRMKRRIDEETGDTEEKQQSKEERQKVKEGKTTSLAELIRKKVETK